jgi:hypothetical protein
MQYGSTPRNSSQIRPSLMQVTTIIAPIARSAVVSSPSYLEPSCDRILEPQET